MEVKRKEKTMAGMFLKYVTFFCIDMILLAAGVFLLMLCAVSAGILLPANYAEVWLTENASQIRQAGEEVGQWIPQGCIYGVYDAEGGWLAGNFSLQERESAWAHYETNNMYAEYKGYYRFIPLENGNICIVKYYLFMRYAKETLNAFLPPPEILMPILDILLFIVNVLLLSRGFAGKVKRQLAQVRFITEKIAGDDLEFETKPSDIKEINEIMVSLGRMKDTLQESLKAQWDMEKQKQEQLSALAHDVKTPLTIIRGNTELLRESGLTEENQECAAYILANVEEIEKYLETMRLVMGGANCGAEQKILPCEGLEEAFQETAKQLLTAEKIPAAFAIRPSEGMIYCKEGDILRAWNNIVSNAMEHTDRQKGVAISIGPVCRAKQWYLTAVVRDYGAGFSMRDLQYADQEFYSGDTSRHDRRHSGLGLFIAKKFAQEQGGFLEYGNCEDGTGAKVALWLRLKELHSFNRKFVPDGQNSLAEERYDYKKEGCVRERYGNSLKK